MFKWKRIFKPEELNSFNQGSLAHHLGIEILEFGDNMLTARMPIDARTRQPFGLLHGGASGALSETLGSIASFCMLDDPTTQSAVGLELNASHLKSAKEGYVYAECKPIKIGKRVHVWSTDIFDEQKNLVCQSRLTVMILNQASIML